MFFHINLGGELVNFKSEKGQAMVEFALILIPLLMILGGIMDFGWVFHQQVIANNASREAARYIAVHYKQDSMDEVSVNTAVSTITNRSIPDYITFSPPSKKDSIAEANNSTNGGVVISTLSNDVTLRVAWTTTTFMPVYSKLIGTITINSTTVMSLEDKH